MQTQDATNLLDEVLAGLKEMAKKTADMRASTPVTAAAVPAAHALAPANAPAAQTEAPADAIDRELGRAPRQTAAVSLLDSPVLDQFREELENESLTVTTVTSLLQLARQALQVFGILAA
jgi:hypothetical protein